MTISLLERKGPPDFTRVNRQPNRRKGRRKGPREDRPPPDGRLRYRLSTRMDHIGSSRRRARRIDRPCNYRWFSGDWIESRRRWHRRADWRLRCEHRFIPVQSQSRIEIRRFNRTRRWLHRLGALLLVSRGRADSGSAVRNRRHSDSGHASAREPQVDWRCRRRAGCRLSRMVRLSQPPDFRRCRR